MIVGKDLVRVIHLVGAAVLLVSITVLPSCTAPADNSAPKENTKVFPPNEVCKLPANASAKIFHPLGAGSWSPVSPADRSAGYSCAGATGVVNFYTPPESPISVEYKAEGTEHGSTVITIKYTAANAAENEPTYRTVFANFANDTLRQSFNEPMPELMRKKILNLNSYFKPDKAAEESFFIGDGFVNLAREHDPAAPSISVTLRIFPDKALKLH